MSFAPILLKMEEMKILEVASKSASPDNAKNSKISQATNMYNKRLLLSNFDNTLYKWQVA